MFYAYYMYEKTYVLNQKKIFIACNFGILLFYTLIFSNTALRYMFAEGREDGRTSADHYYVTPSLRGGGQKGYTGLDKQKDSNQWSVIWSIFTSIYFPCFTILCCILFIFVYVQFLLTLLYGIICRERTVHKL